MPDEGTSFDLVRGETTITRPPRFNGGDFTTTEGFNSLREVGQYVSDLVNGYADSFLSDAWYEIRVIRRRINGKFATNPAYLVIVTYRRPRPGEEYELTPYPGLDSLLEYEP